jgi:DNA adenine methylase
MVAASALLPLPELGPSTMLKPPLKWAGGKRWQVPIVRRYWEPNRHRTLVEPFCGGLAIALGLQPEHARLSDVNPHLINFYAWVKRGLEVDRVLLNDHDFYYGARREFNHFIETGKQKTREAAILFYYLNRTGYNGLCRFNQSGFFNVPFGAYKTINYATDFHQYKSTLRRWTLNPTPFQGVLLEKSDFIYADPPYDVEFTTYSQGGFAWHQQVSLAEWLSEHLGPVVLSNQATARIVRLYRKLGFSLEFHNAPRRISCDGSREPALEVIATRNLR